MAVLAGKGGALYFPKGEPTLMTTEACSQVSGNIYRVTDTTKRYIDTRQAYTVFDNAVEQTEGADYHLSPAEGKIYFEVAPTTPITITAYYLALDIAIAGFHNWSLDISLDPLDVTEFGDDWRSFIAGLRHFTGSAERWWQITAIDDESIDTGDGGQIYSGFLNYSPIVPGTLVIVDTDNGVQTLTDQGDGTLTGDGTGTINYTTGAWTADFDANVDASDPIVADYTYDLFSNRIGTKYIAAFYVDTTNDLRYLGEVFITSDSVNVPVGEIVNESLELEGDGYLEFATW